MDPILNILNRSNISVEENYGIFNLSSNKTGSDSSVDYCDLESDSEIKTPPSNAVLFMKEKLNKTKTRGDT